MNITDVKSQAELFDDLVLLAGWQQRTLGQDPDHPLLAELQSNMLDEESLWLTMLYLAYMQLPSAWEAYHQAWHWRFVDRLPERVFSFPTGFERRGLRVPANMKRHIRHIAELAQQHNGLRKWLEQGFTDDRKANWETLQQTLMQVYNNGRWAGYNTGEILMNNHNFNVLPGDMGMAFSSGPRWGLAVFYGEVSGNSPAAVRILDAQAENLLDQLRERGVDIRIDELETVLCDFHSMAGAQHYIGNYCDMLIEQINKAQLRTPDEDLWTPLWAARIQALPRWSLGEWAGEEPNVTPWAGARKELLNCYRQHGLVEWWQHYKQWPGPEGVTP